ncbi:MAG: sodium:dicarboxylate symporter [Acidobacteria bacterium]|jgi:Na+/H+-dicarboxylate symporter|nr:sodium:dicarboxylate symporter [Acidobacteriota bacterium]MBQ00871.1 sodium:dicarboxylate symporter [Acidobacteriota bacterium]MDP7691518.1 dicarboxylate/amino acid:cation symporter [Vicinamibacterales bacterium]HJN46817.1 dicarboxylate/amino acid:cation symporter [Vicinamibacterales bacterium]|tara:strand:+ start:692 stop:1939 length:1248 start_codon:yes stop_codon:yes gene_type:complete
MTNEKKSHLTLFILGAIVTAVALAFVSPELAMGFEVGGEIFLRLLTMMVVPLVMASVMSGIIGLGDIRKLGRPGGIAVAYYLTTTVMAVIVGLIMVNLIQPGIGAVDQATLNALAAEGEGVVAQQEGATLDAILRNLLLMLFTDNLISSAAETNLLPLIVFSVIFAGMLTTMGRRVAAISEMIVQVNDALLAFILLLMKVAPLGIFCLVTARFGEAQAEGNLLEVLRQTGAYFSTVLAGLAIHALVTLPCILWIFTRRNPLRFMYQMSQALLTAFSTASSTAALPVTMDCAVRKAGVSRRSSEFVLPLGATINMDGTALYEAGAAIFIAQAIGFELGMTQQLVVAVTATLAAIGAAGIPEAGLVTMIIVLNAVGLPVEYVGLILSVDWLLDRFRTTVNAFGDAVGSAVVEKSFVA